MPTWAEIAARVPAEIAARVPAEIAARVPAEIAPRGPADITPRGPAEIAARGPAEPDDHVADLPDARHYNFLRAGNRLYGPSMATWPGFRDAPPGL